MTGWLEYDYVIVSSPGRNEFPALTENIMSRIEMRPCRWLLHISPADACMIVCDDLKGLSRMVDDEFYEFEGNRPNFDNWMVTNHPEVAYSWLDQWVIAFADRAAQLSFNDGLGERIARSVYLRQSAR